MLNDALTEFPEQRFTKELMRISAELQCGDPPDHSLVELFDVLVHFGREIDCDPRTLNDQVPQLSGLPDGSLGNHRLSTLVALLQDTQSRLRCRAMNLAERLEAHDAARQANASYGGVAQWGHASPTPPVHRYQS